MRVPVACPPRSARPRNAAAARRRAGAARLLREFAANRAGVAGLVLLLAVIAAAVLTPVLVPFESLDVTRLTVQRWLRGKRASPDGVAFDAVIYDTRTRQAYIPEAIVRRWRRALHGARSLGPPRKARS